MVKLRFLTLNVWSIPWPVSRDTEERMQAIAKRLPEFDADVIAFQEVWTLASRRALVRAGREAGYGFWWHNDRQSGLLMLSRIPVRALHFQPYTLNGLPHRLNHLDYYGNKGLVHLELVTESGPVSVIATHLHARHDADMDYLGHRGGQVIELASSLAGVSHPVVALGDFNLHEGSPHYVALTGLTGLEDAAVHLNRRENTIEYDNPYRLRGHDPGRRIDYVFTRDGHERGATAARIQRVLDERFEVNGHTGSYSDHTGLMAEILIGGEPSPVAPASPSALNLAGQLLSVGRRHAELRRSEERMWAASGSVACLTAIATARGVTSRRRFLRGALFGLPALGLAGCAGITSLSEGFVSHELDGYDQVEKTLASLARRASAQT